MSLSSRQADPQSRRFRALLAARARLRLTLGGGLLAIYLGLLLTASLAPGAFAVEIVAGVPTALLATMISIATIVIATLAYVAAARRLDREADSIRDARS